jgi:ferredoxin
LGQTAPNPVLTTIRYFRDEYEAHIRDKACPAGVCKQLITFYIVPEKCPGCSLCARYCSSSAISGEKGKPYSIDTDKCLSCGVCRDVCNFDAVLVKSRER